MIGAAGVATMIFTTKLECLRHFVGLPLPSEALSTGFRPYRRSLVDNFRSRWGRRHPFMAFSALPLTLGFYLMYAPPSDLTEAQYFAWLIFTVVLIRVGKTFYSVPHAALGAEMTDDYNDRTSIFGYSTLVASVGNLLLTGVMLYVLFLLPRVMKMA